MDLVSVPCTCGANVGPLDARCRACKAPVSRELREAIEAALESAHDEYREARQAVRSSATVLLVVALLHLGFGLLSIGVRIRQRMWLVSLDKSAIGAVSLGLSKHKETNRWRGRSLSRSVRRCASSFRRCF